MKRSRGRAQRALAMAWLLSLPAAACSLTLNVDNLREGCAKPLVDCNGECRSSCSGGASGSTSGASSGGANTSSGGMPGTSGKAGTTNGGSGGSSSDLAGAAGSTSECMIAYPFSYAPNDVTVTAVHVSGSFTAWDEPGIEMTDDGGGTFRVVVDLPPGRHLYKFVLGDKPPYKWVYDPRNPKKVSDTFLSYNSILDLECGMTFGSAGAGGAGGADQGGAGMGGAN